MELVITTFQGLEKELVKELQELGAKNIEERTRAVRCEGDKKFLYKANYLLRSAVRILKPIHKFTAYNEGDYYQKVQEVIWRDLFKVNQSFAIHSVVNSTTFTHSRFMALKAKDAIVDQFRDHFGRRPNVSTYDPDLIVNVHIHEKECTISLDSSGQPLYKRGYKMAPHEAPLNEVLAAGLLKQTEFENYDSFFDPMCGSGSFITEALMMHCHIPPGYLRDDYAFTKWKDFEDGLWARIKNEANERIKAPRIKFFGADISRKYMFSSKKNVIQIPYGDEVSIEKRDFLKDRPTEQIEFLIMNPPYDVRLESEDIDQFYSDIGTKLKHDYIDTRACIFSGNLEALKKIGLKTSARFEVLNGAIPSKLHIYDLYEGSKKGDKES